MRGEIAIKHVIRELNRRHAGYDQVVVAIERDQIDYDRLAYLFAQYLFQMLLPVCAPRARRAVQRALKYFERGAKPHHRNHWHHAWKDDVAERIFWKSVPFRAAQAALGPGDLALVSFARYTAYAIAYDRAKATNQFGVRKRLLADQLKVYTDFSRALAVLAAHS